MNVAEIQEKLSSEAAAAPDLFADLAKVELYIAESYRSRAFIELLQNADDAGAKRVEFKQVKERLLVANDGRSFSEDDIVAICRSGSSNKHRGGGTIGYRGIGFKSVAGVAAEIEVYSAGHHFRFSKTMTQDLLGIRSDVPLIRIPHPINHIPEDVQQQCHQFFERGFSTIFVLFGLNARMIEQESLEFDETALLFLNNVTAIEIDLPKTQRILQRRISSRSGEISIETIGSNEDSSQWMIARHKQSRIAFLLDSERIVPAPKDKSVIHAFMPTNEFSGALLKLNGDFSTDPSRKTIDMDDASIQSFEECVLLLASLLRDSLSIENLPGIFSPFLLPTPIEGRFRKILKQSLLNRLNEIGFSPSGQKAEPLDVRLRPDWLNYNDYQSLCERLPHVPQEILDQHPELPDFLKWLGCRTLSLKEALSEITRSPPSPFGAAQIFCKAAKQYRYDLNTEDLQQMQTSLCLPTEDSYVSPAQYEQQPLDQKFLELLSQEEQNDDVRYLARRLGIPDAMTNVFPPAHLKGHPTPLAPVSTADTLRKSNVEPSASNVQRMPDAIKAWRNAEHNTLAWFSSQANVATVKDVSQANLGYDLHVVMKEGVELHVEVKSVTRFGDPIRLTNNEYATANQLGRSFVLAIVLNSPGEFQIRFICDPVRAIPLEKRCEQWSWHCSQYIERLVETLGMS